MYKKVSNFSFTHQIVGHMPRNLFTWHQNNQIHLATYLKDKLQVLAFDTVTTTNEKCNVTQLKLSSTRQTNISDPRSTVIEARVLELESHFILIVITESNIQFHDLKTSSVLSTFIPEIESFTSIDGNSYIPVTYAFASGIAKHYTGSKWYILIGYCTGGILVFSCGFNKINDTFATIQFEGLIAGPNNAPITHLSSNGCSIVSGDSLGNTLVWQCDSEVTLKVSTEFEALDNFPVTSVAVCGDELAISAYGSGHLRVYSLVQSTLLAEVVAHGSWINSMEISIAETTSQSYILATVSDDSMVRFWLVKNDFPCIKHLCDEIIKNTLVVSLAFADPLGDRLFVAGYDSALVTLFEKQSD